MTLMKTGSAFPSLTKRQDSKKLTSTTANSGNATPPTVQTGTAKMWRKDLADTINATNEQLVITLHWEHRSFKEQGIDREPTIHIGAVANALERKGRLDLPIVSGKYLRKISDSPASTKVSSCLRPTPFIRCGQARSNAANPMTNRKNSISTGLKSVSRTLVDMNVVPHMMMVSSAARCPANLLFPI